MDGLFGREAKTLLKKLFSLLPKKWEKPYSEVCGYVNARMSIAVVISHPDKQDEQAPPPVGGQGWPWPVSSLVTSSPLPLSHYSPSTSSPTYFPSTLFNLSFLPTLGPNLQPSPLHLHSLFPVTHNLA
jgi:hypothetical protein